MLKRSIYLLIFLILFLGLFGISSSGLSSQKCGLSPYWIVVDYQTTTLGPCWGIFEDVSGPYALGEKVQMKFVVSCIPGFALEPISINKLPSFIYLDLVSPFKKTSKRSGYFKFSYSFSQPGIYILRVSGQTPSTGFCTSMKLRVIDWAILSFPFCSS